MIRRVGIAALVTLGAAACGSGSSTAPATSPDSVSGATASSAGGADAAARFSTLRQACDDELNREKQAAGNSLAGLKAAAAQAQTTFDRCATQLHALRMPASAAADAKTLETVWDRFSSLWHQVSLVGSEAELSPVLTTIQQATADDHAATVALERDLGLPETTPRV